MKNIPQNQIDQWLKKLERESWQLELLVSAFTIFLLIQAIQAYTSFIDGIVFIYSLDEVLSVLFYFFLILIGYSLRALVFFLVIHLMLRGFWIGSIGLRSVQSRIDFDNLHYSSYFTEKLKKKVISLDNLVVLLDEICSVIFSFSFLVISILLSFGLYMLFFGGVTVLLTSVSDNSWGWLNQVLDIVKVVFFFFIILTGLVYLVDYFTLGFFKKYKKISRVYYPIYRFYGFITLSGISRSIYYYLISRFSKKKIRITYLIALVAVILSSSFYYDQYQYFPGNNSNVILPNFYDNMRPADDYISKVSIQSHIINGGFLQVFIRYDPSDNPTIKSKCPEFTPLRDDGLNPKFQFKASDGNVSITGQSFLDEDRDKLLECLSSIYEVSVNDSVYCGIRYHFFIHSSKGQKGILAMIPTDGFSKGENILKVKKELSTASTEYANIPFWVE